jgi:hypothetical protein
MSYSSLPTCQGTGAPSSGTGALTLAQPTGVTIAENDICVVAVQSQGGEAVSTPTATGLTFAAMGSQQGTGTGAGSVRLSLFWARIPASWTSTTVGVADPGDHAVGFTAIIRGCRTSGNPWHSLAGNVEATSDTSWSIDGLTTTVDKCLVGIFAARGDDNASTTRFSAWTNSGLLNVSEQREAGTASGTGGGIGFTTGELATAGTIGATTVTNSTATKKAYITVAWEPVVNPGTLYGPYSPASSGIGDVCQCGNAQIDTIATYGGAYVDDSTVVNTQVSIRFPVSLTGFGAISSASLTIYRTPNTYGDSGTNGDVEIRCEDASNSATFSSGANPYTRTYRSAAVDVTLESGGTIATIDVTSAISDLISAYGAANLSNINLTFGAQTRGWKASAVSYRAVIGTGSLPTLTIVGITGQSAAGISAGESAAIAAASSVVRAGGISATEAISRGIPLGPTVSTAYGIAVTDSLAMARGSTAQRAAGLSASNPVAHGKKAPPLFTVNATMQLPAVSLGYPGARFTDFYGQTVGFKDNSSGAVGELALIAQVRQTSSPNASDLYLYSAWDGTTWTALYFRSFDYFWALKACIQGADGAVHIVYNDGANLSYQRVTLTHNEYGYISGCSSSANFVVHSIGDEVRAMIQEVTAQDGSRHIMVAVMTATSPTDCTIKMGTWPVGATSAAAVIGLDGTSAMTTVISGLGNGHEHALLFCQNPSNRTVVCSYGFTCSEYPTEGIRRFILSPTGNVTWSVGAITLESSPVACVGGLCTTPTSTAVYRTIVGNSSDPHVYIDRINADGSLTEDAFPPLVSSSYSGWAIISVSADASECYCVTCDFTAIPRIAYYYNGSWTIAAQSALADPYGLGGIGWETGIAGMINDPADVGPLHVLSVMRYPPPPPTFASAFGFAVVEGFGLAAVRSSVSHSGISAPSTAVLGSHLSTVARAALSSSDASALAGWSSGSQRSGLSGSEVSCLGAGVLGASRGALSVTEGNATATSVASSRRDGNCTIDSSGLGVATTGTVRGALSAVDSSGLAAFRSVSACSGLSSSEFRSMAAKSATVSGFGLALLESCALGRNASGAISTGAALAVSEWIGLAGGSSTVRGSGLSVTEASAAGGVSSSARVTGVVASGSAALGAGVTGVARAALAAAASEGFGVGASGAGRDGLSATTSVALGIVSSGSVASGFALGVSELFALAFGATALSRAGVSIDDAVAYGLTSATVSAAGFTAIEAIVSAGHSSAAWADGLAVGEAVARGYGHLGDVVAQFPGVQQARMLEVAQRAEMLESAYVTARML